MLHQVLNDGYFIHKLAIGDNEFYPSMSIKLIIGLRNPGKAYAYTRHNAGAWFVEAFAKESHCQFQSDRSLQSDLATLHFENHPVRLCLPHTYMNHSGRPAQLLAQFYRIQAEEILVVHDDLDLPCGRIKLKTGGGHGGHNGLRDIITQLGTPNFQRLRIGIDHPGASHLVHDYVLGRPTLEERCQIDAAITNSLTQLPLIFSKDIAQAMNVINR